VCVCVYIYIYIYIHTYVRCPSPFTRAAQTRPTHEEHSKFILLYITHKPCISVRFGMYVCMYIHGHVCVLCLSYVCTLLYISHKPCISVRFGMYVYTIHACTHMYIQKQEDIHACIEHANKHTCIHTLYFIQKQGIAVKLVMYVYTIHTHTEMYTHKTTETHMHT
jgi:hypothetical protein